MAGRYVVGVDGSPASEAAYEWAARRAADGLYALVTVHVSRVTPVDDGAAPTARTEAMVALSGRVPEALAEYAAPDDTLVVGTDKSGFIHGRVFGAIPRQVAALARSNVAIIPQVDVRFRAGVVAGIDRDASAEDVAVAAAAEAARGTGDLVLLQARPPEEGVRDLDRALRSAEQAVRDRWPQVKLRTRVLVRAAAPTILDAARSAELVVLGPGGAGIGRRVALGRVTHDVVVNANAPVLIVRASGRG